MNLLTRFSFLVLCEFPKSVLIQLLAMFTVQSQGSSNSTVAQGSPAAPVSSGSALSDPADLSSSWVLSPDSAVDQQYPASQHANLGTVIYFVEMISFCIYTCKEIDLGSYSTPIASFEGRLS